MSDQWKIEFENRFGPQSEEQPQERRAHPRSQTIFNRIEDATYAVLRKHEKKTA